MFSYPGCPGSGRTHSGLILVIVLSFIIRAQSSLSQSFDTFLEPSKIVEISSPFRNRITDIHVETGDAVKGGQLLAELDRSGYSGLNWRLLRQPHRLRGVSTLPKPWSACRRTVIQC